MDQKTRRMMMAIAGGYLAYVGGDLIYSVIQGKPNNIVLFILIGAVFVLAGIATVIMNMKEYLNEVKKETESYEVDEDTADTMQDEE